MNTTWIILLGLVALVASASTLVTLVRQRSPRASIDPERLARLRDRVAEREARRLHEQVGERIAEERLARSSAPQRSRQPSTERLWAGGI